MALSLPSPGEEINMRQDIGHLKDWIGRSEVATETLSPRLARQFNATFQSADGGTLGDKAPLLIHFSIAQPAVPSAALGEDGHPKKGGILPPMPLPRRMWAGGEINFHDAIHIGEAITRRSTIRDIRVKNGRSGELIFLTLDHDLTCNGRPLLSERQDIVYRNAPRPDASNPAVSKTVEPAPEGEHSRHIFPTTSFLFRYSAITFNSHRIHYDLPYARDVEGYAGLVVHGPLQATLLCQFAADLKGSPPKSFRFRSIAPIFDTTDFTINATPQADGMKLWTAAIGGPIAMEASATW